MSQKYGFFDAIVTDGTPDRSYSADDVNQIFEGILSNGVFRLYGNALKVSNGEGMRVTVSIGKAIVHNHWYINTNVESVAISKAHATLNRRDLVVLRYERQFRRVLLAVVEGTPAQTAIAPTVTQNDDIYEIPLAEVSIEAGVTTLTSINIYDKRTYTSGLVDSPTLAYRRYTYTVTSSDGERYIDIPDSYNLTQDTFLQVYAAGALVPESGYSMEINEVEGNYMIVFPEVKPTGTVLEFVMIN